MGKISVFFTMEYQLIVTSMLVGLVHGALLDLRYSMFVTVHLVLLTTHNCGNDINSVLSVEVTYSSLPRTIYSAVDLSIVLLASSLQLYNLKTVI